MNLIPLIRASALVFPLLIALVPLNATEIMATFSSQGGDGSLILNNGATSIPFSNVPYNVLLTYNTDNVSPGPYPNYFRTTIDSAVWTLDAVPGYSAQTESMDVSNLVLDSYNYFFALGFSDNLFYSDALIVVQQNYFPSLTNPVGDVLLGGVSNDGAIGTTFNSLSGTAFHISDDQLLGSVLATFTPAPDPTPVPEPASITLLGALLCGVWVFRRKVTTEEIAQ